MRLQRPAARLGWTLAALLATVFFQSLFHHPLPVAAGAFAVALAIAAAWRPFDALLVFAALGPIAAIVLVVAGGSTSVQYPEALTLAVLSGFLWRRAANPEPLTVSPGLRWAGALLIALALASPLALAHMTALERLDTPARELLASMTWRDYLAGYAGIEVVSSAVLVCEGVLLVLFAADLCAGQPERRERVLRMMVVGAAAAASLNVLRLVTASLQHAHALAAFGAYMARLRVNVQYGDRNAAGSYFALALMLGAGLTRRHRLLGIVSLPLVGAGVWLSGSRFALLAAFLGLVLLALSRAQVRSQRRGAIALLVLLFTAAAVLYYAYPAGRNFAANKALQIRLDLTRAGIQMVREHPVFGEGLSRYYALSPRYAGAALSAMGFTHENAHDYFVQIAAELGLAGLAAFLALLAIGLRTLWRSRTSVGALGLFFGLVAYLITCVAGHPLLVPEASYPFWLALGLAAAGPEAAQRAPRWLAIGGCLALVAVAVALPARSAAASRDADLEATSAGLSAWQHEPDGSLYRWAGRRATFFVTSTARVIDLPLMADDATATLDVKVLLDGREADVQAVPADGAWHVARLFPPPSPAAYYRIDLETTAARSARSLRVGRPQIHP